MGKDEFCKLVTSHDFHCQLLLYPEVFSALIPELKDMIGFQQKNPYHVYDVYEHTVHTVENCESDDLVVRLAVFFHDFGKPHSFQEGQDGIRHFKGHGRVGADMAESIMNRLEFDPEIRNFVAELVYYHDATFKAKRKYIKRWLNKIGEIQYKRLLKVRLADIKGHKPDYDLAGIQNIKEIEALLEQVLTEKPRLSQKDLAVSGKDLIEIGFEPGKALGLTLEDLLHRVMEDEVENNQTALLLLAKGWLSSDRFPKSP